MNRCSLQSNWVMRGPRGAERSGAAGRAGFRQERAQSRSRGGASGGACAASALPLCASWRVSAPRRVAPTSRARSAILMACSSVAPPPLWENDLSSSQEAPALGCVSIPGISSRLHGQGCVWRSADPGRPADSAPKKTACGTCGLMHRVWYDRKCRRVRDLSCGDRRIRLDLEIRRVACRRCGTVKQERLSFLAEYLFYTRRFAFFVGRRCRASTLQDVARETRLDWKTVKVLEMQYMREQLRRAGRPNPRVIGVDEISIRKGLT